VFDFIFGGKRKMELIRELLEQRMREEGFDDLSSRLRVKELGRLQLLGTPEGAMVTIVETVMKNQRRGILLASILASIENHRRALGHDSREFSDVMKIAKGPQAGDSVGIYCYYRMCIEHPGRIAIHQCLRALDQCVEEIATW
jgi:hypothetical protein